MKPEDASAKADELTALRALEKNPAYLSVIRSRFEQARTDHLSGCTNKSLSPEKRAEHVEAYHLAVELLTLVPEKIKKLQKELNEFQEKEGRLGTSFRVSDALA